MKQERQKLKAKDFVTIGLLALLSIVLMYGVPMIFIFNYYIMVIAAPLLRANRNFLGSAAPLSLCC